MTTAKEDILEEFVKVIKTIADTLDVFQNE
jgi:hypothetical protein